ncbi:hypothetical protein [Cutibacterium sp. V947]
MNDLAEGVGDFVVISPGDRIAMDGAVETGVSEVDQFRITGGPMPVAAVE